ncbi:MAG: T9SS C-terminal target domain-containing protein [Candidatus Latescibacterota bacterium]|nr:MAG: T9SS C-terminal target domain-containing protein [Candidatus Latescibacterota bacterium]
MKRALWFFVAAMLIAVLAAECAARINPLRKDKLISLRDARREAGALQVEDLFYNDLHVGAFWFPAISNKGYVGYSDISAYYPGGGDQSTVWQAGMAAAGYVEGRDNAWRYLGSDGSDSDPAQYDTVHEDAVVETEADFGYPYPYRRLTVHVNTANKPILMSSSEEVDGDMGMDVTYEWHQWGVRGYDNWVFVHVTIEFSKPIEDFYWGWMSDCDVGDVNVPDVYFDDYAGWDEDYRFCYMRDWDYDPLPGQPAAESTADSLWLSPNVVAQVLLAAPPVGGSITEPPSSEQKWVSKNYWDWNNDISSVQDYFNRLAGVWENPFPPLTDFDYRILNGVGPYDVAAGDVAEFWMAYVIGEGYDDDSHATFNLGTVVEHVVDAQAFFDDGMAVAAGEYPPQTPDLAPDFAADVSADEILVHWDPYANLPGGAVADSFRVYTSTVSKLGPWTLYDAVPASASEVTVKLVPGFYTYIWVEAYDAENGLGSNPYDLYSRLYTVDEDGVLRANENTITSVIGSTAAETALDRVTVAPNPYIGSNEGELLQYETILGFHHLPERCTIYIYTLLGNVVAIVPHDSASGSEYWDMTTLSGESISSGLYFYRVKADSGAETTGKFAVIKGQR